MITTIWQYLIEDHFDFIDILWFYIIWTEVVPWMTKKWKEWRGSAWKCPYCPKGKGFRISTNNRDTTARVAEDHLMKFHMDVLTDKIRERNAEKNDLG